MPSARITTSALALLLAACAGAAQDRFLADVEEVRALNLPCLFSIFIRDV